MVTPIPQSDLTTEIRALIQSGIDSNQVQSAKWLTQLVIDSHQDIRGADAPFYLRCGFEHVRDTVKEIVNRLKPKQGEVEPEWQLELEGFSHVQKAYLLEREGDQVIVPVEQCSLIELNQKIAEYETIAAGCMAHAEELRRYRKERFGR